MLPENDTAHQPPEFAIGRSGPETGAVEHWLRLEFARRFDAAISESLPANLVVLADRLFH